MPKMFKRRFLISFFGVCLALISWFSSPDEALAIYRPELLPDYETPVIDLANFLPTLQEESLINNLKQFETETGWKLRVLTQFDQTPGRAVKDYWGLDEKSILLVADGRGGNLLAFSIGDAVYELMPRTFWIELQTRFGNLYFVRENGKNNAITEALDAVEQCLLKDGCIVVPGLPKEQWLLTLISSIVGGVIFGFASIPRKKNQVFAWKWALIMSPLWGILFLAFGVGPVVTRTSEFLPIFRNIIGFLLGAVVAYLAPMMNNSHPSESET